MTGPFLIAIAELAADALRLVNDAAARRDDPFTNGPTMCVAIGAAVAMRPAVTIARLADTHADATFADADCHLGSCRQRIGDRGGRRRDKQKLFHDPLQLSPRGALTHKRRDGFAEMDKL